MLMAAELATHPDSASQDWRLVRPRHFHLKFLERGLRVDGRSPAEFFRPHCSANVLSADAADASFAVRLGDTALVAGLKFALAPPSTAAPDEGQLVVNVELPGLCAARFRPGPPDDEAQALSAFVTRVLRRSGWLNLPGLCVLRGRAVLVAHVDVVCLAYDGALHDACLLAVVGVLLRARLPAVRWDAARDSAVRCAAPACPARFPLREGVAPPLLASFALFAVDTEVRLLAGGSAEEEQLGGGGLLLVVAAPCVALPVPLEERALLLVEQLGGERGAALAPAQLQSAAMAGLQQIDDLWRCVLLPLTVPDSELEVEH